MKILIASDLHLSETIWKHRPIFGDSYFAWKQIVSLAIKHEVQAVILAGDLLDKQYNPSGPIHALVTGVLRLNQAGISVLFNQGQHELMPTPWIKVGTKTTWLHKKKVILEVGKTKYTLVGCDYQDRTKFQEFLNSELASQADILVCHQVWQDFMGEVGKPQAAFEDVPSNVKLLITGDYHEAIITKHKDMTIVSPGSTHLRSIKEPSDKSVVLLTLTESTKKPMKLDVLPLLSRSVTKIDLTKHENYDHIPQALADIDAVISSETKQQGVPEEVRTPILYVTYDEKHKQFFDTHITPLTEFHVFSKFKRSDGEEVFLEDEHNTDKATLLSMLDKLFAKDSKEYDLAVKLLQAGDEPTPVLEEWLEDQLKSCT